MTQKADFFLSYDGPALEQHSMDVRDLAPALLSFGNLVDELNRVVNGGKAGVNVHVKAQSPGSYQILFEISQTVWSQIQGFLLSDTVQSVGTLLGLLGVGGGGLFDLIRTLQGGAPDKITDIGSGMVRIETGGETFEVPMALLRAYQDVRIRRAAHDVLAPLEKDGIDTFILSKERPGRDNPPLAVVHKNDLAYFRVPEIPDQQLFTHEYDAAYGIVSLTFKEGNKWRLQDSQGTINVTILDEEFLHRVNERDLAFAKGDILSCRMRSTQWRTEAGIRTDYDVLRVIEHRPGARQIPLFPTEG